MPKTGCLKLLIGLAFWSSGIQAQDLGGYYSGMAFNGLISNQMAITQVAVGRSATRSTQDAGAPKVNAEDETAAMAERTAFKASPELRKSNYASFVARSSAADSRGAANLAATLARDPIAMMAPELAKIGLRTDDMADAYALYWMEAWQGVHGDADLDPRQTAQRVRLQTASAIVATPELAAASDAQKQEFADALLVQALLISAARDQMKDDPAKLRQLAAAVRHGTQATGLDLDAVTLTDRGFVAAGSTGAVR